MTPSIEIKQKTIQVSKDVIGRNDLRFNSQKTRLDPSIYFRGSSVTMNARIEAKDGVFTDRTINKVLKRSCGNQNMPFKSSCTLNTSFAHTNLVNTEENIFLKKNQEISANAAKLANNKVTSNYVRVKNYNDRVATS